MCARRHDVPQNGPILRPDLQAYAVNTQPAPLPRNSHCKRRDAIINVWLRQSIVVGATPFHAQEEGLRSSSCFDGLQISDRKSANHTTEMILWSMILPHWAQGLGWLNTAPCGILRWKGWGLLLRRNQVVQARRSDCFIHVAHRQ